MGRQIASELVRIEILLRGSLDPGRLIALINHFKRLRPSPIHNILQILS